jgi:hypothetical protein
MEMKSWDREKEEARREKREGKGFGKCTEQNSSKSVGDRWVDSNNIKYHFLRRDRLDVKRKVFLQLEVRQRGCATSTATNGGGERESIEKENLKLFEVERIVKTTRSEGGGGSKCVGVCGTVNAT